MSVSKQDVHDVANLARLQLTDSEAEELNEDLNKILEYIDTLNEVNTEGVEPLEHVIEQEVTFYRNDEAGEAVDHGEALKRSEEHTSELQSRGHLVCRLLL